MALNRRFIEFLDSHERIVGLLMALAVALFLAWRTGCLWPLYPNGMVFLSIWAASVTFLIVWSVGMAGSLRLATCLVDRWWPTNPTNQTDRAVQASPTKTPGDSPPSGCG
jgi:hypothetical protein